MVRIRLFYFKYLLYVIKLQEPVVGLVYNTFPRKTVSLCNTQTTNNQFGQNISHNVRGGYRMYITFQYRYCHYILAFKTLF